MWISWTLGSQSIAQTSTSKQVFRRIQVYQFFNHPVPNSSITTIQNYPLYLFWGSFGATSSGAKNSIPGQKLFL